MFASPRTVRKVNFIPTPERLVYFTYHRSCVITISVQNKKINYILLVKKTNNNNFTFHFFFWIPNIFVLRISHWPWVFLASAPNPSHPISGISDEPGILKLATFNALFVFCSESFMIRYYKMGWNAKFLPFGCIDFMRLVSGLNFDSCNAFQRLNDCPQPTQAERTVNRMACGFHETCRRTPLRRWSYHMPLCATGVLAGDVNRPRYRYDYYSWRLSTPVPDTLVGRRYPPSSACFSSRVPTIGYSGCDWQGKECMPLPPAQR